MGHWNLPGKVNNPDCPYAIRLCCVTAMTSTPTCTQNTKLNNLAQPGIWYSLHFDTSYPNDKGIAALMPARTLFCSLPSDGCLPPIFGLFNRILNFSECSPYEEVTRSFPALGPNQMRISYDYVRHFAQVFDCSSSRCVEWLPLCHNFKDLNQGSGSVYFFQCCLVLWKIVSQHV